MVVAGCRWTCMVPEALVEHPSEPRGVARNFWKPVLGTLLQGKGCFSKVAVH